MIQVKVLLFASAREAANDTSSLNLQVPEGCNTLQFRHLLAERYPLLSKWLISSTMMMTTTDDSTNTLEQQQQQTSIVLALNEEYITPEQESTGSVILSDGDTIAIIPPISGG